MKGLAVALPCDMGDGQRGLGHWTKAPDVWPPNTGDGTIGEILKDTGLIGWYMLVGWDRLPWF